MKNQHFNGIMKHIKKFEMRGMNKMEKTMEKIVALATEGLQIHGIMETLVWN